MSDNHFIVFKRTYAKGSSNRSTHAWHTKWFRHCSFKTEKEAEKYIADQIQEKVEYKIEEEDGLDN